MKTEKQRYARGLKRRKAVLGAKYVNARLKNRHPFTDEFQALITRYAWGELWTRPGLSRKLRSCITVAMLVALGRHDELRFHVKGALRNGVTRRELQELLLHSAVYCGVPAAHSAFRVAKEELGDGRAAGRRVRT